MANFRTVGEVVARLLELPQDKPFIVVECMNNEIMDILSIQDNDTEEPDPEDDGEGPRPGVVEMLIDF